MRERILTVTCLPINVMTRINAFPSIHAHRSRLDLKAVKPIKPFAPTAQKLKEIVTQKVVARLYG
jgi:hypothetical protein